MEVKNISEYQNLFSFMLFQELGKQWQFNESVCLKNLHCSQLILEGDMTVRRKQIFRLTEELQLLLQYGDQNNSLTDLLPVKFQHI